MSAVEAPAPHLRYGQLEEWLKANGISRYKLGLLIAKGVIKAHALAGGRYYYNAAEIKRDVLDQLKSEGVTVFELKGKAANNGR
jgi:predicted site-specific integrase-resolvase